MLMVIFTGAGDQNKDRKGLCGDGTLVTEGGQRRPGFPQAGQPRRLSLRVLYLGHVDYDAFRPYD